MALNLQQRLDRLRVRLDELKYWRAREGIPVERWTLDGQPIVVGAAWPDRRGVHRFAATAEVPEHWPLEETRLLLDLGGESLVTLSYPNRDSVSFGVDPYHRELPLRHRQVAIAAEATAREPFGVPVRVPRLNRAGLQWLDLPVHRLHLLLRQVAEACVALSGHDVVPHLLDAAEAAHRSLDWPSDTQNYVARTAPSPHQQRIWELPEIVDKPAALDQGQRASVVTAHEQLVTALRDLQKRYPQQGELILTGHAHIDLAWLWPYDETRRKMRRTFHTAVGLMDASEDFRFNQSTAHYYAQMEEDDPALLQQIKARAASGQWETVGGMWVEPDTNMPTGESLTRQILYGQRYFERHFGKRHTVCWLPDCFGFSGALPQLLRQGGIESFFTIKVNWSETNRIPADLFWWEGLDGSRVLAHTFENPYGGYNGELQPDAYMQTWHNFKSKALHDTSLLAIGYGDGGGGTTPEMVEREQQLRDFPVLPRARWGLVADYFAAAHRRSTEVRLSVWSGEIYLELHRATLTTQSNVKRLHRQAERALITAETAASLAHLLGGKAPQSLEKHWRVVLKNEFHDILPGSSIREVYQDAERELGGVIDAGKAAQIAALDELVAHLQAGHGDGLLVVNPSLSVRRIGATDRTVAALGVAVVPRDIPATQGLTVSKTHLENSVLSVALNDDGTIRSIIHKPTGREALAGTGNQLWVYPVDKPRNWDAWDIEEDYAERGEHLTALESIEVIDHGPARAAVRLVRRYRASTITQTYVLLANSPRLDIETTLDWHDRRTFLRTLTPVAARNERATFECANGVVRRSTHQNTSWDQAMYEAAAHRFIDLSEPGFGVALLNSAKYGHNVRGNVLGLSLVRSPINPDPLADEGTQSFAYALYPHAGDWHEGGVREEAEDLNQPLLTREVSGLAQGVLTPLAVGGIPAAMSGLKPAEDGGGLVFRVYEPAGRRGDFEVEAAGWSTAPVTIMEEPQRRSAELGLMPFEVRSWKLTR
ncbi:glycoside hydrolase family 38 C-terminal domain-containing protein [Devosia sp. 66-22]|uniref:alpha-mannosidase n=1 Tax=Devosia sp. 66-22 TaxID=1895753 RepID=UPI00092BE800|nr:glycoside hydrolase family 38 C-terminal domain-containing protein [Devosia sp. 66-22]OJX55610.1 MAG: alpha-mannosidase [Devosia sp. 66-22]